MEYDTPADIRERFNRLAGNYAAEVIATVPNFNQALREMSALLDSRLLAFDNPRFLDLGTGIGSIPQQIARNHPQLSFRVTLVDFAAGMLERATDALRSQVNVVLDSYCCDFMDFEYGDSCYDGVVSSLALHHLRP